MGVVIQEMLKPDFAGVCFTEGPTPQTQAYTIVECTHGCGEILVSGQTTPSHYQLDRSWKIFKCKEQSINPPQSLIIDVAKLSQDIKNHFGSPQDVEWASINNKLFILQARPITVTGSGIRKAQSGYINASNSLSTENVNPLIGLRDDLHEWAITQSDPMFLRGAYYILTCQSDNGNWRLEGHPEWDAVGTAMIIQLLLDGGVSPALQWSLPYHKHNSVTLGIPIAVKWLVQKYQRGYSLGIRSLGYLSGGSFYDSLWDPYRRSLYSSKYRIRKKGALNWYRRGKQTGMVWCWLLCACKSDVS